MEYFHKKIGKDMKVTSLIENESDKRYKKEHGLCVHIEYNGNSYLLDTGGSDKFLTNASRIGINISNVDIAVLSHGHCDHSGGYAGFFKANSKAKVYVRVVGDTPYYFKVGPVQSYVGMPKNIMREYSDRFVGVDGIYKLAEGVWLVPHTTRDLEKIAVKAHMYRKIQNGFVPDDYSHEQSLVFESPKGLVIFNSCSHAGICNIINEVKAAFSNFDIYAVIGGFHLMGIWGTASCAYSKEEILQIVYTLKDAGVQHIYTGHCTGKPAFRIMKEIANDTVHYFSTGTVLEF